MGSPLEVRVGSTGVGLWMGCGAGVGILTPVSLHSLPIIGQLAGSLTASLSQIDSALGGFGWRLSSALNSKVNPLGLRAGWGCGVALGYGWGCGLMLKPSALSTALSAITSKVPPGVLERLSPHRNPAMTSLDGSGIQNGVLIEQQQHPEPVSLARAAVLPPPLSNDRDATAALEKEVAELTKIVLKQQVTLESVQRKLDALENGVASDQVTLKNNRKRKQ